MKAKTLHSIEDWKHLEDPELPGLETNHNGNPDESLCARRTRFSLYLKAAKSKTRQGILLEIIQSDAPDDIVVQALHYYRGFKRGLRTIEKMIARENQRLWKEFPPDPDDPFFWRTIKKTHIDELLEVLGWMQTDPAHHSLMRFAHPDYHPLVQGWAVNAMAYEGEVFDAQFILSLLRNRTTPELKIWLSLWCMRYNSHRYHHRTYCNAIWPFVEHPERTIYGYAVDALAWTRAGWLRLRRYYREHKGSSAKNPDLLELIRSELKGSEGMWGLLD